MLNNRFTINLGANSYLFLSAGERKEAINPKLDAPLIFPVTEWGRIADALILLCEDAGDVSGDDRPGRHASGLRHAKIRGTT
jgi:hypothetical protein